MTRDEAKQHLLVLPRLLKHKDVIQKWADGAEIQYRYRGEAHWSDTFGDNPSLAFRQDTQYRVKPKNITVIGYVCVTAYGAWKVGDISRGIGGVMPPNQKNWAPFKTEVETIE